MSGATITTAERTLSHLNRRQSGNPAEDPEQGDSVDRFAISGGFAWLP